MNAIQLLLDQVLATGDLPTDDDIEGVVTRGSTVRDKQQARVSIRRAAKKMLNAMDSGLADQAAQLAEATAFELADYTTGDTKPAGPRELAADIPRTREHTTLSPRNSRATGARELASLLESRVRTGVSAADLVALKLRADATDTERSRWRADVIAAGRRIKGAHAAGQQAVTRRLASEYATNLADMLAEPDGRDPHEDINDPRELAALVNSRHGNPAA